MADMTKRFGLVIMLLALFISVVPRYSADDPMRFVTAVLYVLFVVGAILFLGEPDHD